MPPATKWAIGLLLFAAALSVRVELLWRAEARDTLARHFEKRAVVEGRVVADPDVRATGVRVPLAVTSVSSSTEKGVLLVVLPKDAAVVYNDLLVVRGKIEAPEAFVTDTGRVFDYPGYLRVQGVSALMQRATLVSRAAGEWSVRGQLFALKHAFEDSLERIFPARDAALLEGILLGNKRGLPDSLETAFIIASLIHVVVLSGYNISIVSEAVLRATTRLPRLLQYALGVALLIFFVLMTGAGSTSIRAGIMALIAILARYLRRSAAALRSLAAAAVMLVLWNPLVVLYDPSFALSFLATLGLIMLSPYIESKLPRFFAHHEQLRSITASTVAVQIYILPALLYYTGTLSLVGLPANILTLPLIPFAMLTGFLAGLLGFLSPLLGLVPALLSDMVLRWLMFVAETAASLPFSHATIPAFPLWLLAAVYVPLTFVAARTYLRQPAN